MQVDQDWHKVVKITCIGVLAVLGTFLNIVVLVMFYKKPSLRSPSNRFVGSLIASDLLSSTVLGPLLVSGVNPVDNALIVFVATSTIFSILVIAMDRYTAVLSPLHYATNVTRQKSVLVIGMVWSISAALASPMLLEFLVNDEFPAVEKTYGLVLLLLAFLAPCAALILVYFKMYVAAHSDNIDYKTMANITNVSLNNFITETHLQFVHLLNQELKFDKDVDSWMFMSTPWPILSILTVYLLFVVKLGPNMMKDREPFNIKHIMMIYNLVQTLYNIFIVSELYITPGLFSYLLKHMCYPDDSENNRFIINKFYTQTWHYFLSKVFDLLDTIFFVLRKKQTHVSFLHVYHHMNMVFTTWTFLRFIKGQQGALCGILNAFIHSIMYSYYFLAALGPQMQKYLWWKKYLTRLQIIQFILGIIYGICLFIYDCNFPRLFSLYMILDVLLFLYLFLIFYKKTYSEIKKSQ